MSPTSASRCTAAAGYRGRSPHWWRTSWGGGSEVLPGGEHMSTGELIDRKGWRRVMHLGSVALAAVLLTALVAAEAQQARKVFRVGVVLGGTLTSRQSQLDAFRQGMRELGYVEGRDVIFEVRAPQEENDAPFAELAADLVRRHRIRWEAVS